VTQHQAVSDILCPSPGAFGLVLFQLWALLADKEAFWRSEYSNACATQLSGDRFCSRTRDRGRHPIPGIEGGGDHASRWPDFQGIKELSDPRADRVRLGRAANEQKVDLSEIVGRKSIESEEADRAVRAQSLRNSLGDLLRVPEL